MKVLGSNPSPATSFKSENAQFPMDFGHFCFGIIVAVRANLCPCRGARTSAGRMVFVVRFLLKDWSLKENETFKRVREPDDVAPFDKV